MKMSIYDAAMRYQQEGTPLVVIAGKEYGSGSSRDWAAKGSALLGVKAIIAQTYERIHRSNLVCMGVLPLQFADGDSAKSLGLTGLETFSITGIGAGITPRQERQRRAPAAGWLPRGIRDDRCGSMRRPKWSTFGTAASCRWFCVSCCRPEPSNLLRSRSGYVQAGMIGLGRMGGNMARRLGRSGVPVQGFSRGTGNLAGLASEKNVAVTGRLEDMIAALNPPRVIWMMVPAGVATDENVQALAARLAPGDIVVDGGNSHYRHSQRAAGCWQAMASGSSTPACRAASGGSSKGYGLMLGGAREQVDAILPLVRALAPAPDLGWVHCGASGAGHFAKMVHNGIEYGLMQAYAEGFALLAARQELGLAGGRDRAGVASRHGDPLLAARPDRGRAEGRGFARRGRATRGRFRGRALDRTGSH